MSRTSCGAADRSAKWLKEPFVTTARGSILNETHLRPDTGADVRTGLKPFVKAARPVMTRARLTNRERGGFGR